jgi:hypothetical protein
LKVISKNWGRSPIYMGSLSTAVVRRVCQNRNFRCKWADVLMGRKICPTVTSYKAAACSWAVLPVAVSNRQLPANSHPLRTDGCRFRANSNSRFIILSKISAYSQSKYSLLSDIDLDKICVPSLYLSSSNIYFSILVSTYIMVNLIE